MKYHLEKGTCTNADVRPRQPLPASSYNPTDTQPVPVSASAPRMPETVPVTVSDDAPRYVNVDATQS